MKRTRTRLHPDDPYLESHYRSDDRGDAFLSLHQVIVSNPAAMANLVMWLQHFEQHGCGLGEALDAMLAATPSPLEWEANR